MMYKYNQFSLPKPHLIGILLTICSLLAYYNFSWNKNVSLIEDGQRRLQVSLLDLVHEKWKEKEVRPKIHAFYSKQYDNDVMMANWVVSWADKGWDPVILSADDAQKNSEYNELKSLLEARELSDKAKEKYLGYVAMSQVKEGGWFAELNVLPLNPGNALELPNGGEMTLHVLDGHSLISANKNGWGAFTRKMIESAQESIEDALIELKKNHFSFRLESSVMSAKQLFTPTFFFQDMCAFTENKMAIRFAFYDMPKNSFDVKEQNAMADQWLRLHRARCLHSSRPIIFAYADGFPDDQIGRSTAEINLWKSSWEAAGWQPFVLNALDARRHPAFSELQSIFQQLQVPLGPHNEACYLRWLAIVAAGGGWMTDIDIFPLHMTPNNILPNDGRFTSYERHVPCLLSASANEWDRVRILLQESLIQHKNQFWSDLFAFQQIFEQNNNAYIYGSEAQPINKIYSSVPSSSGQSINSLANVCPVANKLRAIHFSPFGISQVAKSFQLEVKERSEFIQTWMRNWNDQCYAPMYRLRKRLQEDGTFVHNLIYYNT